MGQSELRDPGNHLNEVHSSNHERANTHEPDSYLHSRGRARCVAPASAKDCPIFAYGTSPERACPDGAFSGGACGVHIAARSDRRAVGRALRIGERLRTGLLHINDQTVADDIVNPFGGVGASGNGTSIGGPANWEEFTQWQWMTIKGEAPLYPL
jgi:hypothetical protein